MLTFREMICESLSKEEEENTLAQVSKLSPFKYSGWAINPIRHARARAEQRAPEILADSWKKFMRNIVWYFNDNKPKETTFKFFSNSLDISCIAQRIDRTIMIITVLPKGKTFTKSGTSEVMLESQSGSVYVDNRICKFSGVIFLE